MTYKRIVHHGAAYYGKHLMAHVEGCSDAIIDKDAVARFLIDLCEKIDMVRFGDPIIERFGEGIEVGISAIQLIETSAVMMHTNDGARELYLDVFSCKDYEASDAIDCVKEHFGYNISIDFEVFYRK
jgi:S-adenosylmethionine/arginine decarboxylase-like enzyme